MEVLLQSRTLPTRNRRAPYTEEKILLERGYSLVAGIDEVGRGPLAGPVVAGVVVLPPSPTGSWLDGVRDSKRMTPLQRDRACASIIENALGAATAVVSAEVIDDIGIAPATALAMRHAVESLSQMPQYLLIDAFPLPSVDIPQKAIVRGDAASVSIAAASIVAKVARDRMMIEMDDRYPEYGFARHKGYGTPDHIRRIREYGPSPIHRYSFAPIRLWGYSR